jgi:[CysO sulfur-carrier protein]-S-L-cysteine hydrolase
MVEASHSVVRIRSAALDLVIAHARREAPRECCGLLIGREDLVEEAWPAANLREGHVSFLVSPEDHFAAIRHARATGQVVIGAYHSHPRSPAVPSATDIEEANDPELLHVIVSLATDPPDVRAYRLADGLATEVGVRDAPDSESEDS